MFDISFLIILALYLPPCIFGYYIFGNGVQSPILGNLQQGVVTDLATIAITLHIWCTIPIVDNPVNLWLEEVLKIDGHRYEVPIRIVSRTILLAVQTGIAILLPHFGDVMAVIGASCVSATVFFFPCLIYLKLYWNKVSNLNLAWICVILLFAVLGSTIGLYSAFIGLIQDTGGIILDIPQYVFYLVVTLATFIGCILIAVALFFIKKSQK